MHVPFKHSAARAGSSLAPSALPGALSVIGLLVALPGTASASQASPGTHRSFASMATSYQNRTIENLLARIPGGRRMSANEVVWPDGVIVAVPVSPHATVHPVIPGRHATAAGPDATPSCYSHDFCGWEDANFTGTEGIFPQLTGFWKYGADGLVTHSWYNDTLYRAWREQFQNRGNELCINPWPNGENSDYNGVNYDDYWLLMSSNPNNC